MLQTNAVFNKGYNIEAADVNMVNDVEIVVRARDFEMGPDIELYIQTMKNDGTLERLSGEGNLNAETLRKSSLGRSCDIMVEETGKQLEVSDVIIFGNTGTFEIFTGGGD